jgi:hypothetical protein
MKKISFIIALIACMFTGNAMAQHLSTEGVVFDKKTNPTAATMDINLNSDKLPAGIEFNVMLPEGFDFKRTSKGKITEKTLIASRGEALEILDPEDDEAEPRFSFSIEEIEGGVNIMIVDYDGGSFESNEGNLLTLNLTCDADKAEDVYYGQLELVMLSDYDGTIAENETIDFSLSVIDGVGIRGIIADGTEGDIYNTAGQRVSRTNKGLYIQNGKKVVKK